MELDFDKYCVVDGSPTTVLPAPRRRSKVDNRKSNVKPSCGNYALRCDGNFAEINFNRYRSVSCRDAPRPRRSTREGNERPVRGSVYQSSKEVMHLRKVDPVVGRKKIEFSRGSASSLPFGIIDSLCSSDEDSSLMERNRSSLMSLSEQSTSSFCESRKELRTRDSTRDSTSYPIPQRTARHSKASSDKREKQLTGRQSIQDVICTSESSVIPINGYGNSKERDQMVNLHKSLSAKLALPHSPTHSESDGSKTNSPKVRFNPARKAFDPFVKSKSHRSPLSCVNEIGLETVSGHDNISCNEVICNPSLNSSTSDKAHHTGCNSKSEKKENYNSLALCSPAHLHGLLKLEKKHGMLYFEFSVKSLEDVFVAKTWKVGNSLTWIYTFHSLHPRRKSNASGWGLKDNNREMAIVGQMNVSCYLCKELQGDRSFSDTMVTEFVLYDIAHLRTNSHLDSSSCSPDASKVSPVSDEPLSRGSCEQIEVSTKTKHRGQFVKSESSASPPLAAAELHPEQEVAAMVVQIPFTKRASLKFKSGEHDICQLKSTEKEIPDRSPEKMHVVIPAGNHSLPSTETCRPSPLLDRWRLGGGCGCGGWDMACPLHVFGNPNLHISKGFGLMDNQDSTELFVQGRKDNVPAFSMRAMEGGKFAVDFHAQLSSLQAFAICIAILHAAEASTAVGNESSKQLLKSDSLRVFADDEAKISMDAIGEDVKFNVSKSMKEALPCFVLNPPFSPIARV